jgi:hypothetical protein
MKQHSFSIYLAEVTCKSIPSGPQHSILLLVDDQSGKTLRQLDFSAYLANGDTYNSVLQAVNPMAIIAEAAPLLLQAFLSAYAAQGKKIPVLLELLSELTAHAGAGQPLMAFKWAADKTGLGKYLTRIKGEQKVAPYGCKDLSEVNASHLCIKGPAEEILDLWNTACRQAIALNTSDTPFIAVGLGGPGLNCRSGTRMVLECLGLNDFNAVADPAMRRMMGRQGFSRRLRQEIRSLDKVSRGESTAHSLRDLWRENDALDEAAYQTCPDRKHRQIQSID